MRDKQRLLIVKLENGSPRYVCGVDYADNGDITAVAWTEKPASALVFTDDSEKILNLSVGHKIIEWVKAGAALSPESPGA